MGLMDLIKGEFIDVIEWTDDSRDTLSYRFPDEDKAIKNGAQLIVRESQVVQFMYLGEFGDTVRPGQAHADDRQHPGPHEAQVVEVPLQLAVQGGRLLRHHAPLHRQQVGHGQSHHDARRRLRHRAPGAFGTFDFKIVDPALFIKEVAGSDHHFRLDEFADTMRSRMVSVFSEALATAKVPVLDVATRYSELGEALLPIINPAVTRSSTVSRSPASSSRTCRCRRKWRRRSTSGRAWPPSATSTTIVKFQMAQGMTMPGGGGAAGTAAELAMGFGMAQQMMQQGIMNPNAPATTPVAGGTAPAAAASAGLLSPADVAAVLGVPENDVMSILDSGELKAKKIGASYRVTRAALDAYLAQ
jgi:excisionase family DNA binding protein